MLINLFEELAWHEFVKLPDMQGKTLNEQVAYYKQYLSDLDQARQSLINYQNKGVSIQTSSETPGDPVSCNQGMDVVFLIDNTGSMASAINGVKSSIASIVQTIITESGGDYRLGLTIFDEYGNTTPSSNYSNAPAYTGLPASQRYININNTAGVSQYITAVEMMSVANQLSFQAQLNLLNDAVNGISLGHGNGAPEPGGMAVDLIQQGFNGAFRSGVAKLVILITDNQPGGDDDLYNALDGAFLTQVAANCLADNIQVLVLTSRTAAFPGTEYYILSDGTNGSYTISNTLAPADIQTEIENICDSNANPAT